MKRAIFFVLLLDLVTASFSQNLVVNPGFESWTKINKPTGWNIAVNCLKDSSSVMSGLYSCRHTAIVSETKNLGQTIAVVAGKDYRFSFSFKTEVIGTEHGCRIWCDWKDSGGNSVSDVPTKLTLQPSTYMKSDTWQQFSIDITAPVNATNFTLEVRTYQNNIAYFDDFIFERNITTQIRDEVISEIKIYPNPAHDYLNISNLQCIQHIVIQGLTGSTRLSLNFNGEQSVTIPVSGLPSGLYILRITAGNRLVIRKIIIK